MDKHDKDIKLTFYIVCGLLLGAPFIWKIIKILPELIEMIPNLTEVLSSYGYAILVLGSLIAAYKLKEAKWLKIVGVYSTAGVVLGILNLIMGSFAETTLTNVLFSIFCAPFVGVDSSFAVITVMLVLTIISYALLNRLPEAPASGNEDNRQQN